MAVRINKYLSEAGVCSRREADRMIEAGRITIGGEIARPGQKVEEGDDVRLDGKTVKKEEEIIVLAMNKPEGIVCTTSQKEKDNIIDYLNYPKRVYPVGRLDKNSEGLILLTNDGELMDNILRARNYHEKEYVVTVDRPVTNAFIRKMEAGVPILDTVTRPCEARKKGEKTFHIILTQGLNRQIRRMCEALGYRVRHLKRIRIMNIRLGDLPSGSCRPLTPEEYRKLKEGLKRG